MKRFVLTGPESTGKSTLGEQLVQEFNTIVVPEFLREFYANNNNYIDKKDMELVAECQLSLEQQYNDGLYNFLLLDTNIITLKIYYEYYFKQEPTWFHKLYQPNLYTHYFLMDTSIPWVYDAQRDSPEVREELFHLFEQELQQLNVAYTTITGNYTERFEQVKAILKEYYDIA